MENGAEQSKRKPLITVKNLRKVYRMGSERVVALEDINVTIGQGEVCCILGTSGSGKSTLLNMLAGLEKPTRGQVFIGKRDVAKMSESELAKFRQKYVGFVFQSYNLMGALTALENVSMPLMFKGMGRSQRNKQARQMLKNVGLGNRYDHKPTQMSGGQQQRVGIARAFVSKPRIVFADEPTGNLDSKTTIEVMELMVNLSHENDQTLILVTHNAEIAEYADRVLTLIDGRIVSDVLRETSPNSTGTAATQNEALEQTTAGSARMTTAASEAARLEALTQPRATPRETPRATPRATPAGKPGEATADEQSTVPEATKPATPRETPRATPAGKPGEATTDEQSTVPEATERAEADAQDTVPEATERAEADAQDTVPEAAERAEADAQDTVPEATERAENEMTQEASGEQPEAQNTKESAGEKHE